MTTNKPLRAVAYVRLSSHRGDADPSTSPARQREACEGYCKAHGWRLVDVVEDLDVSGSDKGLRLDRPGLRRVRALLPKVDVVIFSRLDRLARNVVDFRTFAEEAAESGVALVSVEERLDLTDATGRFVATILAAFAEMEAATITARSTAGIAKAVELRRWRGGRPPFGYRIAPHKSGSGRGLELDADEAEVVRGVVRRVLEGASLFAEAERLNAAGIKPRLADRWSISSVRAMVTGAHLLGYMKHKGEYVRDKTGAPEVVWPPLISPSDHHTITRRYPPKGRAADTPPCRKAARLLSGLALCSSCGRRMRVNSNAQGVRYACHSRADGPGCAQPVSMVAQQLDQHVEAEFLRAVGVFKVVTVELIDTNAAEDAAVEADIQQTAAELTRPGADVAALAARLQSLHDRRAALREAGVEPVAKVVETGQTFAEAWAEADLVARRGLLSDCLDGVEIRPGKRGVHGLQADRVRFAWRNEYGPEVAD